MLNISLLATNAYALLIALFLFHTKVANAIGSISALTIVYLFVVVDILLSCLYVSDAWDGSIQSAPSPASITSYTTCSELNNTNSRTH